jgi:hypothetical protein
MICCDFAKRIFFSKILLQKQCVFWQFGGKVEANSRNENYHMEARLVAHIYNPSHSEGREPEEDHGLRPAQREKFAIFQLNQ